MKKFPVGVVSEICLLLLLAGMILLNYPFLGIFSGSGPVLGFPSLVGFLFLAWGLLIVMIFLLAAHLGRDDEEQDETGGRREKRRP